MFMHPYISKELARERQRDMQAHARHHRLIRLLRAEPGTAQHREQPRRHLLRALRAAALVRVTPQT